MAIHYRTMAVYFYSVEPIDSGRQGGPSFAVGQFPLETVFNTIRIQDPATEEYRIRDDLFGGETLCVLHEDGPQPVLGAYYRDNLSIPLTEYKGEIGALLLRDGEALVDAAYAAFFPGDVVGLVRTSSKAPGFAKIGTWLSLVGGYPCGLFALRDVDTLAQLDSQPTGLQRLRVRIRRNRLESVAQQSHDVAGALRAAADLNSVSDEVGIELRSTSVKDRAHWSQLVRQEIEELISVLPDFEEAKVKLAGVKREVNLLRANVQCQVEVSIDGSKRVGPKEAAEALFSAYAQEQGSIELALEARHER